MKKLLLAITILFTVSQSVTAQLSTNQKAQVTTMISTATSAMKVDIN